MTISLRPCPADLEVSRSTSLDRDEHELRCICDRFRSKGCTEWLRALLESELMDTPKRTSHLNARMQAAE